MGQPKGLPHVKRFRPMSCDRLADNRPFSFESESEMKETKLEYGPAVPAQPLLPPGTGGEELHAWEMIENGRYQPRRIKGSCVGRELG